MSSLNKCVFLDRDGVINTERGDYTFKVEDFEILPGVVDAVKRLKEHGYHLIIITNQAGINKGIYSAQDVLNCYEILQKECQNKIDDIYYCPYHPNFTESLGRKPNTLMFEKARAKYNIDLKHSWMIGDRERDIIAGNSMGLQTILIDPGVVETAASFQRSSLFESLDLLI